MREIKLRGIPFLIHDEDALSGAIERNGDFWESDILDYIRDYFPHQKTIIDVGANIGNHTVYFANFLKCEAIAAFEPDEENYKLLKQNTALYWGVVLFKFAASDVTGIARMVRNMDNYGAHEVDPEGAIVVQCMMIDDMKLEDVTLLKIDVEWHEPQVLEGAWKTIDTWHPLILIEDTNKAYDALLSPHGYQILAEWPHHGTYLYQWEG